MAALYTITDIPEENRTRVMKVVNPVDWFIILLDLSDYKEQVVTIKLSAQVMRVGAAGTLRWQINNSRYPSVGQAVYGAKPNIWHEIGGEWTGALNGSPPVVYLNTWRNDSERTTFYIDNVQLTVTVNS
ncbi:MAG: hypothetical protein FWG70_03790 [Oscillospiraceae bacterium]|nr:hypothetical protein [Oscillospiraceae bacterium]